jgi:hypothetical protein
LEDSWQRENRIRNKVLFFTLGTTAEDLRAVALMVGSLRTFGGELAEAPLFIYTTDVQAATQLEAANTRLVLLNDADRLPTYPFRMKVAACAQAEQLAPPGTGSLVWIDPYVLVVQPPLEFDLGENYDAAFRPVHIRNVGLPPEEPLDAFWKGIYTAAGVDEISTTTTSFIDGQCLRSYFNSHTFSVNPALGLMQRWKILFQRLAIDPSFQSSACGDETHRVFLFQALLSALIASSIESGRVRILPPSYNYPYHLQEQISADSQLTALNEAVCFTYEDLSIHPATLSGIQVYEPLRSWLEAQIKGVT